jgi:hypothetical protein
VPPYPGIVSTIKWNIEDSTSYFDLETNRIVKSGSSDIWQLGFECGKNGWHILTNSGAGWFLHNTKQANLSSTIHFPGSVAGLYDIQSAYPDSTAAGNWLLNPADGSTSKKEVYLLGKLSGLDYTEIKKVVFINMNDTAYQFYFNENETGNSDTITITKTDTANFVYYSFSKRKQINPEPEKSTYDLVFCPYYDLATLFNQTIPYLVRGVLLNTSGTTALIDSINNYAEINAQMLGGYKLTPQSDAIGYRWKEVIVDQASGGSVYTVKRHYTYIIHTSEGNFYKLRFLSYMLGGKSGYPQFEFKKLNE